MQCKYIDVCFSLTLPVGLFLVMFSIISMEFFGLEAVESGYLMSYFGVLQMVSEVEVPLLPYHYLICYLFDTCCPKSRCNIDRQILTLPCSTWLQNIEVAPDLFYFLEWKEIRARKAESFLS